METAQKTWELDNNVKLVDPERDAIYTYDVDEQKKINDEKPWRKNPRYFNHVRISAVALLKMTMHARSGGNLEVMGLMQGKISGDTFVVTDAFRLPVEGTETRVNAQDEANEYMVGYLEACRQQGKLENAVGWYHSHPGYGCWLSGIDVSTQHTQQMFSDPFCAVVIDPDRTISAGKVEIGAFRTFPEDYKTEAVDTDGYQSIPLNKAEDFGAHSSRYYSLEVSHFKSTLDSHLLELLWNKYWAQTLSQNPLTSNHDFTTKQIADLAEKIRRAEAAMDKNTKASWGPHGHKADAESTFEKIVKDGKMIAGEEAIGVMAGEIKAKLFNDVGGVTDQEMAQANVKGKGKRKANA